MSTVVDKLKDWVAGPPDVTEEEGYGGPELTIVEHLVELRQRVTRMAIALIVGTIIGLLFFTQIFDALKQPLPETMKNALVYIEMTEMFTTYFKVAIFTGAVLAMPVFMWQILGFVAPGLTRKERRLVFTMLPLVFLFFLAGVAFGYFVVLPFATHYLLTFSTEATATIRVGNYFSFVTSILFWLGLAFQTPLVIYILARLNLVTVQRLARYRKYAILAVFILAAAITPTPDPFNQTLVAIPLYLLYELGILFARFA